MKILIHSNGPNCATGYGTQTRQLAERLWFAGHDVAVSCTYGQQGGTSKWRSERMRAAGCEGITLYPGGYELNGNDIIHNHALHHFEGDPLGGWIIPLLDLWCLVNPLLADFNIAAWCPVDHAPVPPDVLRFFHRNADAVPIAMSRFGERLLTDAGLNPVYIPLAIDTTIFKPSPTIEIGGVETTGRQMLGIDPDAFLVGMVAMNKGWSRDRKGFNEAFRAFGLFWKEHPDAVLYVHADWPGQGTEGIDLRELAIHAAIPHHALVWADQYAYRMGYQPHQMAAAYTAFDVLLAPSHGEGFCVPLIESQACGTPVIINDFSSQPELLGAGWKVHGQLEWDPPQKASYVCPDIGAIVASLNAAYDADRGAMVPAAVAKAAGYDSALVFAQSWLPFLAELEAPAEILPLDRSQISEVAVLIPAMKRPENVQPLVDSLCGLRPYFICDADDAAEIAAVEAAGAIVLISTRGSTFAEKINSGVEQTTEPWLFVSGDDVRFHEGWVDEADKLSDRYDVIGTNDTTGAAKNPDVAAGRHADHFFVRRSYIDEYGACLDGPGVLAPETYRHWFTDKEIVNLAKARNAFSPCLDSIVEHLHPGYDAKPRDEVYQLAQDAMDDDRKKFLARVPLIEMARTSRAKAR